MKSDKFANIISVVAALIGAIIGALYYPIYVAAWVLHKILRFLLAICYFLMFRHRMAVDIIKNLFVNYE